MRKEKVQEVQVVPLENAPETKEGQEVQVEIQDHQSHGQDQGQVHRMENVTAIVLAP